MISFLIMRPAAGKEKSGGKEKVEGKEKGVAGKGDAGRWLGFLNAFCKKILTSIHFINVEPKFLRPPVKAPPVGPNYIPPTRCLGFLFCFFKQPSFLMCHGDFGVFICFGNHHGEASCG